MTTLDFELAIGSGTGGIYPVVARTPAGEAAISMRMPMTPVELDHQLAVVRDKVLASSAVMRRAPTVHEEPVRELGRRLFEALIADDVLALYVASRQHVRENGSVLRLVLRVRPPELARLPWELLFDPGQQDYLGLSLPLVRYPEVLAPRQPLQVAPPLRILGMVARPGDQHALEVDDEQRRLHTALAGLERDGLVELGWVAGQTYSDLDDALDQQGPWHVFHFIGHGGYNRDFDEGALALADHAGRTHWVGADDISRLLAEHHTLRLVVLNACDTGRGSALDAFSSTAGALIRRGIPAVVAMQFEITNPAAIVFADAFYQKVAKRRPVDASVMYARRALRLDKNDTLEWCTPVLYLRAADGRIFDTNVVSPPRPTTSQGQVAAQEVDALYDQALNAFWTDQWDQAVVLLEQVLSRQRDYPDAAAKLEQARHRQQLITFYAQGCAAAETQDWPQVVAKFTMVADADPTYPDVRGQLEDASRQQQLADLSTEARRLYRARQWAAVLKVGDQLHALYPAAADLDGLVTSAWAEMTSTERAEQLASRYNRGQHLLDTGEWQQAIEILERVAWLNLGYRDTSALLARARQEFPHPASPLPYSPRLARLPKVLQTMHHGARVNAVAFSPDGCWLATADNYGTARIWDATSGQELATATHEGGVWGVAFSPDGRRLATASKDNTARIWALVD